MRLGTGVVGVFTRGPALLAQQAAALADASGGRFALGIGASSDRIVEGWNRMPFSKPLSKIAETLDFLDAAFAGERTSTGFKLEQPPAEPVPIVLAALRGKMLRLAVERAAGAFTNFLPLAGLPRVTEQLERRARGLRAPLPVLLPARGARAGRAARAVHVRLLRHGAGVRGVLPLARLRRADRRDGARPGGRRTARRAVAAAPWDVIEDTFIFGTPDEMRERLDAFVAGGITLPILTPITTPDRMGELIEALAPE